jgi:hypothetical protein
MIGNTLTEQIVNTVKLRAGIKAVDLVLAVMEFTNPVMLVQHEYESALAEAIASGEIIEVDYVLPEMDYRTKSIYFPKGTTFEFNIVRKIA